MIQIYRYKNYYLKTYLQTIQLSIEEVTRKHNIVENLSRMSVYMFALYCEKPISECLALLQTMQTYRYYPLPYPCKPTATNTTTLAQKKRTTYKKTWTTVER